MKLITATAAAFLLMTGMAFAQTSMSSKPEMRTGSANIEHQLTDMENQWAKASLASDGQAVGMMLSDDFVNLDSDGTTHTKAETVARTSKAKFEVSELSDIHVNPYGDSAIVTGVWTGKGTDSMGKPIDTKERWTDTWVKKDGKWQCVASASATIMPAK